jgi:DNA-binding MarR family transcriptional regulator
MKKDTIDLIIENLFYVLPIIHKKLLKIEPSEAVPDLIFSRIHLAIMLIVSYKIELPISEIAKKLLIPKPQMTHLINSLASSGMIEKKPDSQDRRVIHVALTSKGKTTLKRCDKILKNNARKNLSYLTEKEQEDLSQSLIKLREIGSRL